MTQILRITIDIGLDAARVTFGGHAKLARFGAYLMAANSELQGLYGEVESGDIAASVTLGPDPVEPSANFRHNANFALGRTLVAVEHEARRQNVAVETQWGEPVPQTLRTGREP